MQGLIDFLDKIKPLGESERQHLETNIPIIHFKKGAYLLKKGQISQSFYFVLQGCVRLYYPVGIEERTAFFYCENEFVSSYESYVHQTPAKHNFQCIEDVEVAKISREQAFVLLEKFPDFEFLARVMMEKELAVYQDIIAAFITLNPEERYRKLMMENPELLQRIPQYYLASFIGVKPESLSRIRKRIVQD